MAGEKLRLRFRKTGVLRLLSHLDMVRGTERMLRRADIPFRSTLGFHPTPRMVFALSLPLKGRVQAGALCRASAMGASGSTAWTWRAPVCAAQKAMGPVAVPSSSTTSPGFTAARMGWWKAVTRPSSESIPP